MTNKDIAQLLREIACVYFIKSENRFKIIAYEKAADNIEVYPQELKDLWKEGKLRIVPGVGEAIVEHLDELFRTGCVKYFSAIKKGLPAGMFALLTIPGFGPKRAYTLAKIFKIDKREKAISQVIKAAKKGKIALLPGFGEKLQTEILKNINAYQKGKVRENRIRIDQADVIAAEITEYIFKKREFVERVDVMGSLRRRMTTIGDIDIAISTKNAKELIKHVLTFPKIEKVIKRGSAGTSFILSNGRQVDIRVQFPDKYGAMLQYFTGSKNHNIHLREMALNQKKSLSEYGIKFQLGKTWSKPKTYATEQDFYKEVGFSWIPPEIREDRGEIEAAQKGKLPKGYRNK